MIEARRHIARFSLAWVCSFAYLFIIYYPVASISFAHHDQYRYFALTGPDREVLRSQRTSDPQWHWLRLIGRPVAAELEHQIFERVRVVDDLTPIRVFGVGLYALAMAIFVCFLLELGLSSAAAFCLSGALFTLPAVQFSVCMASFNHPVAHILALASALFMRLGSRASAQDPRWYLNGPRIVLHTAAIGCLVVALLSYSASAFVVLFPIAAEIAFNGIALWPATRRHLIRDVFLISIACLVYFAIIKHYYVARGGHEIPIYKVEVNANLLDRLLRIPGDLLWPTLNLWNVHVRLRIAAAVAFLLASGLGLLVFRQLRATSPSGARTMRSTWSCFLAQVSVQYSKRAQRFSRCWQLVAGIGLVLALSEATYFAAPCPMTLYRTHFALGGITVLLMAGSAASWGSLIAPRWRHKAALTLGCVVLGGAGLVAHTNVLQNCLNDQLELGFISAQISAHATEPIRRIHVIKPRNTDYTFNGCRKIPAGEEFNAPTSECGGRAIGDMVCAALLNVFDADSYLAGAVPHTMESMRVTDPRLIIITCSAPGQPVLSSPDTLVIDMNHLLNVVAPAKPPASIATASRSSQPAANRTY
jgi:hypothetical protein